MKKEPYKKKGKYTQDLRLIGTIIAILFWWYDAYIDTYIFLEGEFADNMLRPGAKEIWLRLVVMASLIGLSFYSHKLIARVKRAEGLKDLFVSTVSHELRTPLTSIIGSLDIIKSGMAGEVSGESKKIVGIAHKNSKRLLELINDILDLQKLESGLMIYHIKPMPIAAFVEEVVEAMEGFADQYNVKIKVDNAAPDAIVKGDWARLTQALTNLIANAVRYSPAGDEVVVSVSQTGSLVRIAVLDHGPGVPHEFKDRIFSEFAQAETGLLYGKGGTGLGLNISKRIVERHEGKISFVSEPNESTSFFFDIPEFTEELGAKAIAAATNLDELTGLFNRAYFDREFKKEVARAERANIALAVLLIEVEGFGPFCEEQGAGAGEERLKEIASALRGSVKRPSDMLARYTSESFVALLPDTDSSGAAVIVERMHSMVNETDIKGSATGGLSIHIGVEAVVPESSTLPESILEKAKDALMKTRQAQV